MKKYYKPISDHLREKLATITPSEDWGMRYYPCKVTLVDGRQIDRVYVVEQESYVKVWGVYPEDDRGKSYVLIENIADIEESPSRLPAKFANKIYGAGESGMGYTIFTVLFRDGTKQPFVTGNAVDFITYPQGKNKTDVLDVLHEGRQTPNLMNAPNYFWCIYSEKK